MRYTGTLLCIAAISACQGSAWIIQNPSHAKNPLASTIDQQAEGTHMSWWTDSIEQHVSDWHHPRRFRVFDKKSPKSTPHLFRHFDDVSFDSWIRCASPEEFWTSVGYQPDKLPEDLQTAMVHENIAPHVRFLVDVFHGGSGRLAWNYRPEEVTIDPEEQDECSIYTRITSIPHTLRVKDPNGVPLSFFRSNIDRTVAPWHAYLKYHQLLSGPALFQDHDKLEEFCNVCQSSSISAFAMMCNRWESNANGRHGEDRIRTFCTSFRRGLLPAVQNADSNDLSSVDCTPSKMVNLLVSHGANFLQKDKSGVSMLHWAAGTGHLEAVQTLLEALVTERYPDETMKTAAARVLLENTDAKDGATVLHWACAGVASHFFGCGGSLDVCTWLLEQAGDVRKELACAKTWTGSTPLMWAAWSGTLPVIQVLIDAGADGLQVNNQKQNAAHWAAAAGHLDICKYLYQTFGREYFASVDSARMTAIDYASVNGHADLGSWVEQGAQNA